MLSIIGIAPHPPIIIPEIGGSRISEVEKTVRGLKKLSGYIKAAEPELVIVITPHGQATHEGPSIQSGQRLTGNFGQFGHSNLEISMQTDLGLLDLVVEEASKKKVPPVILDNRNSQTFIAGNLDHGATVPLYYLQQEGVNVPGLHIAFSYQPNERLYSFGSALRQAVERRGLKTAVIASGDLSHRLIPGAPAGYNPRGREFDQLLVDLIREKRVDELLNIDGQLVEDAGECGLRSFVIALGMLKGEEFDSEIISYEGPFGVGYLVAALRPS